jgi:pyruvate/2-oxoglutarate dehydrogenase complex dihydrolipoamide acyltransferase (E2) component
MPDFRTVTFPKTRIATFDVCAVGLNKHRVVGMVEFDVTETRKKIRSYKRQNNKISFTAWLIKVIGLTLKEHDNATGYLSGKRKMMIFNDINVSIVVEKKIGDQKVPVPVIIEKANERTIESITKQLEEAKEKAITDNDIVLHKKTSRLESIYYLMPGFVRRYVWKLLLRNPRLAFNKMGNVAVTSIGMMGNISGWFIPISVHPVCFGISGISKKPRVIDDKIEIREILNVTVLIDHDVIDGAPAARFISELAKNTECGLGL